MRLTYINKVMLTALDYQNRGFLISVGIVISIILSYLTVTIGVFAPVVTMVLGAVFVFLIVIFRNPFIGLMSLLVYCIVYKFFEREVAVGIPFGYVIETLYVLIWIAIIFKISKQDWNRVFNDLSLLFLLWFVISVLQLVNPENPALRGWTHEIRSSGLDSFVLIPAGFLLFKNTKHLNVFLTIIISMSLLAALNGIKQAHFGLFPGEHYFLINSPTHSIWGKIRVFSFYGDAGQFGASQAHLALICAILALGQFKIWKRCFLGVLALLFFYGMLISGTRGALYALVPGIFLTVLLFKNIKLIFLSLMFLVLFVTVLKFTHIGSSNYHVYRLRSALNPEDASLNVRFHSQAILRDYLKNKPFGGGLGVIGYAGKKYNEDKFLSTVEPDSYWVKVWAMYGIVGFILWFSMMMYIIGKGCGIIWGIKDEGLRIKLIALTAGVFGIFVCSYGNEVINSVPSSIITYLSMVFIFLGPELDKKISLNKFLNNI